MDFKELRELIQILEESGLSELEIEDETRRIRLQKHPTSPVMPQVLPSSPHGGGVDGSAPATSDDPGPGADDDPAGGLPTFDSPMVGTFYAAPAPDADPFVRVGDHIEENQTVCIVEAMKLMNEVGAKFTGVIESILVENAQPVEFGQPLFAVRPPE